MIASLLLALAQAGQPPGGHASAADPHRHHHEAPADPWMERHGKVFAEASERFRRQDYRGAAALLQPSAEDAAMPPAARLLLGAALDRTGDYAGAVAQFGRVLESKSPSAARVRLSAQVGIGAAYVRWGKFDLAEKALQQAAGETEGAESAGVYSTLADAHAGSGRQAEARVCARIAALWMPDLFIRRGGLAIDRPLPEGARCTARMDAAAIHDLERHPAIRPLAGLPPSEPAAGLAALPLARRLFEAAAALEARGWRRVAERWRGYALERLYEEVRPECEVAAEGCASALIALADAEPFRAAPPEIAAPVLGDVMAVLADVGQFSHAADYGLKLAALEPRPGTFPVAIALSRLRGQIKASVSFDPVTGELRERDPLDFLEEEWLTERARDRQWVPADDRLERARPKAPAGLVRLPYGATSAAEDGATLTTSIFIASMSPAVHKFVLMAIENNIRARNLELPVKLLADSLTARILDEPGPASGKTLRVLLLEAMEAQALPEIPVTTREAFEAAEKLAPLGHLF